MTTEPEATRRREYLRGFLADNDFACPGCGYNLRGLPDPVCPECRQELELTVGLAEPHSGALFLTAGSLFAGAGAAGAVLASILIISILERGFPSRTDEIVILLVIPGVSLLLCAWPALRLSRRKGRRWFRGLPDSGRRTVVAGAVMLPVVCFAVFMVALLNQFF